MNFNLLQVLLILRAHYKAALYTLLGTVAIGLLATLLLPKQYTASTSLVFDVKTPDPIAGILLPVVPGFLATQMDIINSDRVAQGVVKVLRLGESPTIQQEWRDATGGKGKLEAWVGVLLLKKLKATASKESALVTLSYTASEPAFAAFVANAFAQVYIDANIELRADPARQYARWFSEQGKTARENLEKAQTRLSDFQQKKGIVAKDEQLDAETAKLNDLYAQLTVIQGQTVDAQSKQKSGADTLPEVMQNSVIQTLRSDIAKLESKLQEAAGNLGKNHPQYQRMEAEIAGLKKQLELQTQHVTKSFATSRNVGKDRESELKAAIAAQKKRLLELKTGRDQLAVFQRDVDAAQSANDAVTKRYNQTSLESQVTQTNVAVLSPADVPTEPSFPIPLKVMAISGIVGVLLGGGIAFLLELLDRRVRSIVDLAEMLQLPVLAVIERPRLKQQGRLVTWWRKTTLALR